MVKDPRDILKVLDEDLHPALFLLFVSTLGGAIRGNIGTVLTIYIICCMVLKIAWITPFPNIFTD